jgi:hypothetical protein
MEDKLKAKRKERMARQHVSRRLRLFYEALKTKYEKERDALMERLSALLNKD